MAKGLRLVPVGITLIYLVVVLWLCRPPAMIFIDLLLTYGRSMLSVWAMVGLGVLLVAMVRRHRAGLPPSSWMLVRRFFAGRWAEDRLVGVVLPLLCLVSLIATYNLFKESYLPGAGFWFGHPLALTERSLLGIDAWRITHALLPSPWITQAIDLAYHGWFAPMVVGVALCSYTRPDSLIGWRYLSSYLLLWSVQGSLIAYLLPAAGPAMHARMAHGPSKFAALVDRLHAQDLFLKAHGAPGLYSVEYQHKLAMLFGAPALAIGGGVSAMPSLHNAMAVLFACAGWSIGRRCGVALTAYALLIWIGSIHLGWHYALDGIVACLLTIATWLGVGSLPAIWAKLQARHKVATILPFPGPEPEPEPLAEAA